MLSLRQSFSREKNWRIQGEMSFNKISALAVTTELKWREEKWSSSLIFLRSSSFLPRAFHYLLTPCSACFRISRILTHCTCSALRFSLFETWSGRLVRTTQKFFLPQKWLLSVYFLIHSWNRKLFPDPKVLFDSSSEVIMEFEWKFRSS